MASGGVGGEAAEAFLAGAQGLFGAEAFAVLEGLGDGAADGGGEAGEGAFEDEIGGAVAEGLDGGLLAEGAGDEDEGDAGAEFAFEGEGGVAVDAGEVEVGEDEVGRIGDEGAAVRLGVVDVLEGGVDAIRGEQGAYQLVGAEIVFQVDDAQGLGCAWGHWVGLSGASSRHCGERRPSWSMSSTILVGLTR